MSYSDLDHPEPNPPDLDRLCTRFQEAWESGPPPRIEDYLAGAPQPLRAELLAELISLDFFYRRRRGETPTLQEYRERFPDHSHTVDQLFPTLPPSPAQDTPQRRGGDSTAAWAGGAGGRGREREPPPDAFGRYRVLEELGGGGFAVVYKGFDDQLNRCVAIKVPRRDRLRTSADIASYLAEARTLAGLKHPHLIDVYDYGTTDDGVCYSVAELVEGPTLAAYAKGRRLAPREAAQIASGVAEALHYVHTQGLAHRDVKPENILIDAAGRPWLTDFGLALHELEQRRRAGELAGTFPYMAPEQARGEAHRLDGRADVWALGVVLYELLTGRRPFQGKTDRELLDEILHREPKPPRMIDDAIPAELERIVLRCLKKAIGERYTTAADLAADLRAWLAQQASQPPAPSKPPRRVAWWSGVAGAAVLVLALAGAAIPKLWRSSASGDAAARPPAGDPAADALLVERFAVEHFIDQGDTMRRPGVIGQDSLVTHEGDAVQIHARLRQPAYCFLVAFNTNGSEQLLHPAEASASPEPLSRLRYPPDPAVGFGLTDGPGQQAFVLIASPEPLPSYKAWRAALGELPWRHTRSDEALLFDGRNVCRLPGTGRDQRGDLVNIKAPFHQLCHTLQAQAAPGRVHALAFPVLPR